MKTVHHCPVLARRSQARARADPNAGPGWPQPAAGTNPGGPRPLPPCPRRNLANPRRAPASEGQTANGEMAARRLRRLISYRPLPPGVVRAYCAGCSNHPKRNAAS